MDKMLSQEERIRRAEQIYNRRIASRESYIEKPKIRYQEDTRKIKNKMVKKMIMQIIICMIIYFSIYGIQQSNLFASEQIKEKTQEVLNYDIGIDKLKEIYNTCVYYFQNKSVQKENIDENLNEQIINIVNEDIEEQETEQTEEKAIGGAEEVVVEVEENKTQEQLDIEFIKQNVNMIWPLNGVKTSGFGAREPTEIVTANHRGIDIGGNTGETIVAAMDGLVTQYSESGDYGKHLQIENGEVLTLYAHCSKLCVSEGTYVKQGDKIAEVGQTGRATGPHLHFEIRRNGRFINPEDILGEK